MLKLLSIVLKALAIWDESVTPLSCINNVATKYLQHSSIQVCGKFNSFTATDTFLKEIMKNKTIYYTSEKPANKPVHTDLIFLPSIYELPYGMHTYNRRAIILTNHLYGAHKIFRISHLLNAVLLHRSIAYTWFPYNPPDCWHEHVPPKFLAVCDAPTGVFNSDELFPEKIPRNLQKCPLRIETSMAVPFSSGFYPTRVRYPPPEDSIVDAILQYFNMSYALTQNGFNALLTLTKYLNDLKSLHENSSNPLDTPDNIDDFDDDDHLKNNLDKGIDPKVIEILRALVAGNHNNSNTSLIKKLAEIDKVNADNAVYEFGSAYESDELDQIRQDTMEFFNEKGEAIGPGLALLEHKVDLTFHGSSFDPNHSAKFEFTPSYAEDTLSWFVPTPRKETPVYGLYTGLSSPVWILFLVTCCTFTVVCYWANGKGENFKLLDCGCETFAIILGQNSKPPMKSFRFIEGIFLLFILHIVAFYCNALLANILVDPVERPIKSAEEALDKGLTAHIRLSDMNLLFELEPKFYEQMRQTGSYKLRKFMHSKCMHEKKCITLAQRFLDKTFYAMMETNSKQFHFNQMTIILDPPLAKYRKVMYMSPGNPLAPRVNRLVQRIIEAGIPDYRLQTIVKRSEIIFTTTNHYEELELLSIQRLQSAFYLYGCAVMVSLALFLGEVLEFKVKKKSWTFTQKRKATKTAVDSI